MFNDLYSYMQVLGFLLALVTLVCRPEFFRIHNDVVKTFLAAILIGTIIKIGIFAAFPTLEIPKFIIGGIADQLKDLPLNFILGVWWEDCFFVLPVIYVYHWANQEYLSEKSRSRRNYVSTAVAFVFSLLFLSGHIYQGWWALTTLIYWNFSYRFGRKHGLGAPILIHLMIDISNVLFLKWYLQFKGIL